MPRTPEPTLAAARRLRREMTGVERKLWELLRAHRLDGHSFRRQHPIPPCVADFACARARLVVELDGEQHSGSARDERRDAALATAGWRVLRFWNREVLESPDAVATVIACVLRGEPDPRA